MQALMEEQENLASTANLSKSIADVQELLDRLNQTRAMIEAAPGDTAKELASVQRPVQDSFKNATKSLREVYLGHGRYQKLLDTKFKDKPFPTSNNDALSTQPGLINRAIAMHLLREGQFDVASQFLEEASNDQSASDVSTNAPFPSESAFDEALGMDLLKSEDLRKAFANMYHILHELRDERNLLPAIAWARENSDKLELRGSNLEFELGQLQFVYLFTGGSEPNDAISAAKGRFKALDYARQHFSHFQTRYLNEISQLATAMAYHTNLASSPYRHVFLNADTWEYLAGTFAKEFCSLLGLSAESPLYVAATAGAIALPTLLKLQTIMKDKRAEWTTAQELPVEIPLPPSYQFHSIFVCPVSKEQTTDENPPMMMPCGHVVAQETLARMSRGSRFKCPYCPNESKPTEARKLVM